jgi:3-hydroxyacyl-CoA dehydrogenase/enoyl-CoA hydratase/3-hydroxybutyryl-CoA epimerase
MTETATARQLLLVKKPSGCATVIMDAAGKTNSIGSITTRELEEILRHVVQDKSIKALVLTSGKVESFIIGADLQEVRKLGTKEALVKLSSDGQQVLSRLENLHIPTVAAINGLCLGGGLELAMACTARIASTYKNTLLGLPETRIGLVPGLGGTQRLPRLAGLKTALDLILGGEPIGAKEALEAGMVDRLCERDDLLEAAEKFALALAAGTATLKRDGAEELHSERSKKLLSITERAVRVKTRGNYPAQTRAIDVIRRGITDGVEAGMKFEAESFAELAGSDIAANLMSLFFATDFSRQSAQNMALKFGERAVQTIAVVGGGMMATSIAALAAAYGFKVVLHVDEVRAGRTFERLQAAAARVRVVHDFPPELVSASISIEPNMDALKDADFVLETTVEDMVVKTELLRKVSGIVKENCVIASNTSCLPLAELAAAVQHPERFLGVHFFTPVERMPLVEIISVPTTSKAAAATASGIVTRMDKTPVALKDGPGFLINRLLAVCIYEAAQMAAEGLPLSWIDSSIVEFGMPMGPWEVMDQVGLDLSCEVAQTLHNSFGTRFASRDIMERVEAVRAYGQRTGTRIFMYDEAGKRGGYNEELIKESGFVLSGDKPDEATRQEIVYRLFLPMVDEAARCLEERIVMRPREVDMALVLGIAFPAFRGGVLRWADTLGLPVVAEKLERIYAKNTPPRQISQLIRKYVAAGRGFYSLGSGQED